MERTSNRGECCSVFGEKRLHMIARSCMFVAKNGYFAWSRNRFSFSRFHGTVYFVKTVQTRAFFVYTYVVLSFSICMLVSLKCGRFSSQMPRFSMLFFLFLLWFVLIFTRIRGKTMEKYPLTFAIFFYIQMLNQHQLKIRAGTFTIFFFFPLSLFLGKFSSDTHFLLSCWRAKWWKGEREGRTKINVFLSVNKRKCAPVCMF